MFARKRGKLGAAEVHAKIAINLDRQEFAVDEIP